jgi:hypothetical protein
MPDRRSEATAESMERQAGAGREEGVAAAPRKGCIRSTQGPWTVRRRGRGGGLTTSLRHPTPRERENNRQRERRRRQVAARIYAGLRARAGYALPKHADQNDVLRALCAEAGYHVDDEGNVTRHQVSRRRRRPSLIHGRIVSFSIAPQPSAPPRDFFFSWARCDRVRRVQSDESGG